MRSLERVYAPKLQHLSNGSLVNNDSLVEIVLGPVVECGSFTITAPKKARVWDFTHSEIDFETGLVRVVEPHLELLGTQILKLLIQFIAIWML